MKRIFLKPIGTIRDLGTAHIWAIEIAGFILCLIGFVALLILL